MPWYRRLVNLIRLGRLHSDIDREMAFHIAELADELMAGGMSEADAWREARRRFGNPEVVRDRIHDVDVMAWLGGLLADLRYAIRALRSNPGFTLVAVLSLGLGIGANTAIFSVINAVMLRSLPVRQPEELVQLTMDDGRAYFTNPLWEAIRDRQGALAGTLAFTDRRFNLTTGGVVRHTSGAAVSGSYFNVLGVSALAGRLLEPADDVRGCSGAAVLSHGFWQREYGGDADAVGRTISLDGHLFPIIGVAERGFYGVHVGRAANVFIPICSMAILWADRDQDLLAARSLWFLNVFGRLRPGNRVEAAQAVLASTAPGVFQATIPTHWTPDEQRDYAATTLSAVPATSGMSIVRSQYSDALVTLLVVVGVVLLIACANVAQLLLARAAARDHEMAVRLALGSGRTRLVRQLLTESVLLALLGAAVGTLFARWSSGLLVGFLSQAGRAVSLDLSLDIRVLAFTIAVATVTGLLFGMAPAWRSTRVAPQSAMRGAGRGLVGDSRQRVAKAIVVGQMALSLVLVAAAGLLVGSFRRLATVDPGFRSEGVLVVSADWSNLDLPQTRHAAFPRVLLDRLRTIPGVHHASASLTTPISGTTWTDYVAVEGITSPDARGVTVWFNAVTDGFLATLGTRLIAGRDISRDDGAGASPVVLVNHTLARRVFGDASPLGRQMRINAHDSLGTPMEIVGVVQDAKYRRLDEETPPTAYVSLEHAELWGPFIELTIRSAGAPSSLIPGVTDAMRDIHPAIGLEFTTLADQVATSLARPRLLATLSGFFGALALFLAVIGLYGTMSYSVARRRNEIGVRVALGAARAGILGMVASEAGRIVTLGVVLGIVLTLVATRLVAAFLYGVTASDPVTLISSVLTLAAVAMAAGLVPAWRAAGVDPMAALREE